MSRESLPDILVLGLGTSGIAAAEYCIRRLGTAFGSVIAVDAADSAALQQAADRLRTRGAQVQLGTNEIEGRFDLCIASPGIPPHAPLMQAAREACDKVVSEVEFAFVESSNTWVAVTGTNGKTTTTALITHLLTTGGMPALSVGNIGSPAIEAVEMGDAGVVLVAEVSSFQLALTEQFRPRVAVLLNITPDHIDWHGSLERYAEDKTRIFANLTADDVAVVDIDDARSAEVASNLRDGGGRVVRISLAGAEAAEARVADGVLELATAAGERLSLVTPDEMLIKGPHNVSNALAAAAAAHAMGISADSIREGLRSFAPIEHRLEPAGVASGAEWFNDSKATNPDAVSKALAAFGDRPLILLLGGRNKGNDFGPLALEAAERARFVILFGEACGELAVAFEGLGVETQRTSGMREAVRAAARIAEAGDAVVLSPACASFDEFSNYEERGRQFKAMVAELAEKEVGQ